jgi:hypothetical protein
MSRSSSWMPFLCVAALATAGDVRAGEAARLDPADRERYVVFDAATSAKPPGVAGDKGVALDIKASLVTSGERKAVGMRVAWKPELQSAALILDPNAKMLGDPDFPVKPQELLIHCHATRGSALVVRIGDGDDLFESESELADEEWRDVKLALPAGMAGWRTLSKGDGALDARVRRLEVGLRSRTAPNGTLELSRVSLLPSPLEVRFTTRVPGNLFVTGDKPTGTISLGQAAGDAGARIVIEDAFGNVVRELEGGILGGKESEVALPDDFGYYVVRARVRGYRADGAASYAMIPDNRVAGPEPNSPFGVVCHWGDYWYKPQIGEVVKRSGIAWIRDGVHQDDTRPGGAYEAIKANGLCMFGGTAWCPAREEDVRKPDGTYQFQGFLGRRTAWAKTVGAEVDFYDMCNEPVFAWSRVFGRPRWLEVFSGYFAPQYLAAVQQGDPGGRIFWEGYPDQAELFIKSGGGKSIGGISPHPYAHKAEPEDHDLLNGGYAKLIELTGAAGLKWPVWIGEIGFTTFIGDSQHFKSVSELEQAGLLVRAITLHLAAGVEKVHYYDMVEWTLASWGGDPSKDATNCEYHFGLVRKDLSPKPGIVAYANLIAQTKGCQWLGRARLRGGNDVHGYVFQRPGEKPGLVAWMRKGTSPVTVPAGAAITDLFGKLTSWPGGDLTLSVTPVFISGWNVEVDPIPSYALLPRIHDATAVKLGPRYGSIRSTAAAVERKAKPAPVERVDLPPPVARSDAVVAWNTRLYEALLGRIAKRKGPSFVLDSLKQAVRIEAVEGQQLSAQLGISSQLTIEWKRLTPLDRLRMAQAMLADGNDEFDNPGNALVAYHAMAVNQIDVAKEHLAKSGPLADLVKASFEGARSAKDGQ